MKLRIYEFPGKAKKLLIPRKFQIAFNEDKKF